MIAYFATSALIKLYADESDAVAARRAAETSEFIATSLITYAGMRSALARKWRSGNINEQEFESFKLKVEADWNLSEIISIDERLVRRAGAFAEMYSLRGFDAVHLAAADALREIFGPITFACFDAELSRAATSCGMAPMHSA